jgi:hypothetical protein
MFKSLRLWMKVSKELKEIESARQIVEDRQKQAHAFMMELSAAGYQVVKIPTL